MVRSYVHVFILVACSSPVGAQWLDYPTAGIPRTPDGKPDLAAPAPRSADGGPDISGIWQLEPSCPPEGCAQFVSDYPIGQEFRNFGWKLPGGLPYQPWERSGQAYRRVASDRRRSRTQSIAPICQDPPLDECLAADRTAYP
jgi:hypothetical protein